MAAELFNSDVQNINSATLIATRVLLRPPRALDWKEWVSVRSSNEAYLKPFEPTWSKDYKSKRYFKKTLAMQTYSWKADHRYCFLIFKTSNNTLIGGININNVCRGSAQFASLGYWIDKHHEGHGYMFEAASLVLNFLFLSLKLHRVNASCVLRNDRSRKLLEKLGFNYEGKAEKYLSINGAWEDHYLYGLNIEDWSKNL
jgi:ribosomal-protein-alanine N-acetyltransferase